MSGRFAMLAVDDRCDGRLSSNSISNSSIWSTEILAAWYKGEGLLRGRVQFFSSCYPDAPFLSFYRGFLSA